MSDVASRDANDVPTLLGVSSSDGVSPIKVYADPITHRLLVDATGGGSGFTVVTASETPNGTRTVFTFLSAASQPTFIVSDNAMTRSTTAAGTVNWTWNAGALQATMSLPPSDDIVAIV